MKLADLTEDRKVITPVITWRQSGDKAWIIKVVYDEDHIYVHSNKNRKVLEKLIKDRFYPKYFTY